MIKISKKATTLIEVIIAISIGIAMLLPIGYFFSQTGKQVSRTQNYTIAAALARRICQYVYNMPYDDVPTVNIPGKPIGGDANDYFFGKIYNLSNNSNGIKHLTENELPNLYSSLTKYHFSYVIIPCEATFQYNGTYDERIKSIRVIVNWRENGKDWSYLSHVYVVPEC